MIAIAEIENVGVAALASEVGESLAEQRWSTRIGTGWLSAAISGVLRILLFEVVRNSKNVALDVGFTPTHEDAEMLAGRLDFIQSDLLEQPANSMEGTV